MPGALLRCFCDGFGETARCSAEKRRPIAGELDQVDDRRRKGLELKSECGNGRRDFLVEQPEGDSGRPRGRT